ncbi:MAG: PAS domain-containing protein [Planctomycetota bacterium]|nr:MAG: PAS domain-containing protein [Planctomycetota bacterium]
MKSLRNLYVMGTLATLIVAGSLVLGGQDNRWKPDMEAGQQLSASVLAGGLVPIVSTFYLVGPVGVICLGWYWLRLVEEITSISKLLKTERPRYLKPGSIAIIKKLSEAINQQLSGYSSSNLSLKEQVKDLHIQIQVAQRQKRNTEAIIYGIRDAVIVIDAFDKLLMANDAAGKLFNFDFKSSQHKPIRKLVCSKEANTGEGEFIDFLHQSKQGKGRHTRREINFSKSEKSKTFDCIVSCVYDDREQVCGVVAVLHDITREKEISQMKSDFVNHVSHELKTPLASISAYSEMLIDGEAEDEQTRKDFYSVIQSQATRLNRLIEDLLNTSRIESGLITVEKRPVSLTILIEEQLQMIKSYTEEKNITIIGQKPIVFDQVYVDRDMISQVIVNLLSNAVKYTPSGGSIKVEGEVDEIAGIARVNVVDTGVGIPEDEIEHVFDKFYRVSTNEGQAKGTGLGLNLVKQIVEKVHNGRVFVRSKVGEGSTFGFELPLATAEVAKS